MLTTEEPWLWENNKLSGDFVSDDINKNISEILNSWKKREDNFWWENFSEIMLLNKDEKKWFVEIRISWGEYKVKWDEEKDKIKTEKYLDKTFLVIYDENEENKKELLLWNDLKKYFFNNWLILEYSFDNIDGYKINSFKGYSFVWEWYLINHETWELCLIEEWKIVKIPSLDFNWKEINDIKYTPWFNPKNSFTWLLNWKKIMFYFFPDDDNKIPHEILNWNTIFTDKEWKKIISKLWDSEWKIIKTPENDYINPESNKDFNLSENDENWLFWEFENFWKTFYIKRSNNGFCLILDWVGKYIDIPDDLIENWKIKDFEAVKWLVKYIRWTSYLPWVPLEINGVKDLYFVDKKWNIINYETINDVVDIYFWSWIYHILTSISSWNNDKFYLINLRSNSLIEIKSLRKYPKNGFLVEYKDDIKLTRFNDYMYRYPTIWWKIYPVIITPWYYDKPEINFIRFDWILNRYDFDTSEFPIETWKRNKYYVKRWKRLFIVNISTRKEKQIKSPEWFEYKISDEWKLSCWNDLFSLKLDKNLIPKEIEIDWVEYFEIEDWKLSVDWKEIYKFYNQRDKKISFFYKNTKIKKKLHFLKITETEYIPFSFELDNSKENDNVKWVLEKNN